MDTPQQDIFTRLGMASASDEQKQKLAEQMAELTMVRVMDKVGDRLSEAHMQELERLTDQGADDQVEARLVEWVPGYQQLVEDTAREVGDQLVADQQAVLAKVRAQATQQ